MESTSTKIQKVVIVGGGTAGWMTAAALSHVLHPSRCNIQLIESPTIGTLGVGEATIPVIQKFNQILGIDENDFIKNTQGTFKLGIEFENWGQLGNKYIHPFGAYGMSIGYLEFHHYWLRYHAQTGSQDPGEFSIGVQAARAKKFMPPAQIPNSPLSKISYAYHFDAGLYANYLRRFAEARGVERIQQNVTTTNLRQCDGFIESLQLDDGNIITGDLFIDCSGFRGLLIEKALHTGYESWSHWLPCDKAVTVATKNTQPPDSYTRSTAHSAGWQWRIPLQHRTGNGHVYSSNHMDDDEAKKILITNLEGEPLSEPRVLSFTTGMRRKFWNKNCVAIGLSSGFLEPLESTSIHLIQSSISKLIALFPYTSFDPIDIEKYNSILTQEILSIRDFIILHYKVSQRDDSVFWNYCRQMDIPVSLENKIALYQSTGRLFRDNNELFDDMSWFAVMHGQGLRPKKYHPLADELETEKFMQFMGDIKSVIYRSAEAMPNHDEYIKKHCAAKG